MTPTSWNMKANPTPDYDRVSPARAEPPSAAHVPLVHMRVGAQNHAQWLEGFTTGLDRAEKRAALLAAKAEELRPAQRRQRSDKDRQLSADRFAERLEIQRAQQAQDGGHSNEQIAEFNAALPVSPWRSAHKNDCPPGGGRNTSTTPPPAAPYTSSFRWPQAATPTDGDYKRRLQAASMVHVRVDTWSHSQWLNAADQWEALADRFGERIERSVHDRQLIADRFSERIEAHRMRQDRFTGRHSYE